MQWGHGTLFRGSFSQHLCQRKGGHLVPHSRHQHINGSKRIKLGEWGGGLGWAGLSSQSLQCVRG